MKKSLFIFMLFIFCSFKINAECTDEQFAELSFKSKDIEYVYELYEDGVFDELPNKMYNIILKNIDANLIVIFDKTNQRLDSENNIIKDLEPGETYSFTIKAVDSEACSDQNITSKYIVLPTYNRFTNSEKCSEFPEFYYCKSTYRNSKLLSHDEFLRKITMYQLELLNPINKTEKSEPKIIKPKIISKKLIIRGIILLLTTIGLTIFYYFNKKRSWF